MVYILFHSPRLGFCPFVESLWKNKKIKKKNLKTKKNFFCDNSNSSHLISFYFLLVPQNFVDSNDLLVLNLVFIIARLHMFYYSI